MNFRSGKLLVVFAIIFVGSIIVLTSIQSDNKEYNEMLSSYPTVSLSTKVEGTVVRLYKPSKIRLGWSFVAVKLDTNEMYSLRASGKSADGNVYLKDVFEKGTFVEKAANSDTLRVTYNESTYYFLLKLDD